MVYDAEKNKFKSYCRRLTRAERVAAVFEQEKQKSCRQQLKEIKEEEKRWYPGWQDDKAQLYIDMLDLRKEVEFLKWQTRHRRAGEASDAS